MAVFAHAEDLCGPHGRRIGLSENVKSKRGVRIAPLSGLLIGNRGLERVVVDVSFDGLRIEFLEMRLFGTRRSSDAGPPLGGMTDTAKSVPHLLQHSVESWRTSSFSA